MPLLEFDSNPKMVFEFPLTERFRGFLRLENLLQRWQYYIQSAHWQDHHTAVLTLLDIYDFAFRNDIKGDLLSDLARYKQVLCKYSHSPNVSEDKLKKLLFQIDDACKQVDLASKFGGHFKSNEWLANIKTRLVVPSSICSFDMGFYYQWTYGASQPRIDDLETWMLPFAPMFDAVALLLDLSRNLALDKECVTTQLAYQQPLSGHKFDMMRVEFDKSCPLLPDFGANRHVIFLRFAEPVIGSRSVKKSIKHNEYGEVTFHLSLCGCSAAGDVLETQQGQQGQVLQSSYNAS